MLEHPTALEEKRKNITDDREITTGWVIHDFMGHLKGIWHLLRVR